MDFSADHFTLFSLPRAFRVAAEPLEALRRYATVYAREQAYCHFSPALIANLERNWDAKNRRG